MATFTASPTPSSFGNVLYNPMMVDKAVNETVQGQQQIGATDMAMVGRAASSLLGMSEDDAAAAYPGMVADLQRNGFARFAPAQYPGHAAVQGMVQRGMTLPEQYQYGLVTAPGVTDALKAATAPLTFGNTGAGGGGTGGSAGGGGSFLSALADIESGDKNIVSGVDTDSQGRTAAQGGNVSEISQGHFQIQTGTWRDFAKQAGVDINQYPNAMSAPREIQARVASVIPFSRFGPRTQQLMHARFGDFDNNQPVGVLAGLGPRTTPAAPGVPAQRATAPTAPPPQYNPAAGPRIANLPPPSPPGSDAAWLDNQAKTYPGLAGPGGMPTVVPDQANATPAPSPIALRTGGTDVAGPGAGSTTLPDVAAPNQLYGTGLPGVTIRAAPLAPSSATGAPAGTAVVAAGTTQQPPAPPQPAARPVAPPAAPPATGQNSPQFQAAMELNRRAQALDMVVDPTGRAKALAASLRAQAALYMQADSVSYDPTTGIGTKAITGERLNAALPNAHYVWDEGRGAYIDTSGTHPPVTPPSPRMMVAPSGDVLQAKPGGGVTVAQPADPASITTRKAAETQGEGVGKDVAKQVPALAEQGRNAAQAIGNIDYGINQIHEATRGGIPTGYFSAALANAAAAAKSLGIDTSRLGVDPAAVGNIQSAQKTLGVVAGAILQQAIGKGGQITDAKIDHFIHTQPGIETDPMAIERVLNWARSQFVYENEMSKSAMTEAASSPTGTLPLNWQARYYRDKGFAPIYDPATREMQQPDGRTPSREPRPSMAPVNPSERKANTVYDTPKGDLKWTGTGWVAP
jgi:hypothetical protein